MQRLLVTLAIVTAAFSARAGEAPRPATDPADRPAPRAARSIDPNANCLEFGCNPVPAPAALQLTRTRLAQMRAAWHLQLPEPADGTPLFVSAADTPTGTHDLLVVMTTAGRTLAFDARDGRTVWTAPVPAGVRWTSSTPAIDPQRHSVYACALDGRIHRYSLSDGSEVVGDGWPELLTNKPDVEKCSSPLTVATAANGRTYLYATTAGYPDPGDAGDYQGHLVTVDLATGSQTVFNAICSDRAIHFDASGTAPGDCAEQQAGIWPRAGAVYDRATDRIFVTVGNGPFDADRGGFDWSSSVVALRPDGTTSGGTPLDSYTPSNYAFLTSADLDLGSTTIAILPDPPGGGPHLGVQAGKDGNLRLLDLGDLSGKGGPRNIGGELQIVALPQGGEVLTHPATWADANGLAWVFVTSDNGIAGFSLDRSGPSPRLVLRWSNPDTGATPVVSNGLLYYAGSHSLRVLDPTTGRVLWNDASIGTIHWETPLIIGGWVYIEDAEGGLWAFDTTPPQ